MPLALARVATALGVTAEDARTLVFRDERERPSRSRLPTRQDFPGVDEGVEVAAPPAAGVLEVPPLGAPSEFLLELSPLDDDDPPPSLDVPLEVGGADPPEGFDDE